MIQDMVYLCEGHNTCRMSVFIRADKFYEYFTEHGHRRTNKEIVCQQCQYWFYHCIMQGETDDVRQVCPLSEQGFAWSGNLWQVSQDAC